MVYKLSQFTNTIVLT